MSLKIFSQLFIYSPFYCETKSQYLFAFALLAHFLMNGFETPLTNLQSWLEFNQALGPSHHHG